MCYIWQKLFQEVLLMKKSFLILCFSAFAAILSAYNPPAGGELFYRLSAPDLLSGASTACDSATSFSAEHIAVNPALTADEQRIVASAYATALFPRATLPAGSSVFGTVLDAGILIPSKLGVFSGVLQGVFSNIRTFDLGFSGTVRAGFAKAIDEKLNVGADIYTTIGNGWALAADLGFVFKQNTFEQIPFLTKIRYAGTITAIGKSFSNSPAVTGFPGIITPQAAISGVFYESEKISAGASLGLAFPSFQNIVFDAGLHCLVADMICIRSGWTFNLRETVAGTAGPNLYLSVNARFAIRSKDDSFMSEHGWQQSEIVPALAYRALSGNVQAVSAGAAFHLGVKDTAPPEILIWDEGDYEE